MTNFGSPLGGHSRRAAGRRGGGERTVFLPPPRSSLRSSCIYPHMVERLWEEAYTGGSHASAAPSERLTNFTHRRNQRSRPQIP